MESHIELSNGILTHAQIKGLFDSLPCELTFQDENDVLRFYTQDEEPIFTRTPEIIGTDVRDCHDPKSYPAIDLMIENFKSGKFDRAEHVMEHKGKLLYILYLAVRGDEGNYVGILEFVQDITRFKRYRKMMKELEYS